MGSSSYDGDDVVVKGIPAKDDEARDSKMITYTEETDRRRLDVEVGNYDQFPGGLLNPVVPVFDTISTIEDPTGLVLTASYQTLHSIVKKGKLIYFAIEFTGSSAAIKLTVDSAVIFEFDEIGDYLDVLESGSHPASEMFYSFSNSGPKTFIFSPKYPLKVATDWKIEAKSASNTDYASGIVVYSDES